MKTALLRISDTEPLLSVLPMFEAAGYRCLLPNRKLRDLIRDLGGRNVDEFSDMARRWGAEMPPPSLPEVGPEFMESCDLYVDVNGRNGTLLWQKYGLKERILCYFINGGEPRNVPDKGDCQTPEWPMMTTAQHYRSTLFCPNKHPNQEAFSCDDPPNPRGYWTNTQLSHPQRSTLGKRRDAMAEQVILPTVQKLVDTNVLPQPQETPAVTWGDSAGEWMCPWGCGPLIPAPWLGRVYVFWPKFCHLDRVLPRVSGGYSPPVSFVHNSMSWGGSAWWPWAEPLGVQSHGGGNSPSGLVPHSSTMEMYSRALCGVYLKSGGAVDYSILEGMFAGCPMTFHTSYRHNCRLYDLLEPGVTCLEWDSAESMRECVERLRNPHLNRHIGEAGRERAAELGWADASGFRNFLRRNFP